MQEASWVLLKSDALLYAEVVGQGGCPLRENM